MGLLNFLKKNKPVTPPASAAATPALPVSPADKLPDTPLAAQPQTVARPAQALHGSVDREQPATVQAYDEFGRAVQIPLASWRDMMLANAAKAQDDPDKLYGVAIELLQFRMGTDALPVAERLHAVDPNRERSTAVLGIVLMDTGDPAAAERLFAGYLDGEKRGGRPVSGVILTNRAKALFAMGDEAQGTDVLWQAMEADPNQENGLGWFGAMGREQGGESGFVAAMQRVAALPGAWRPQVWLARAALDRKELNEAKTLYREALARAGTPAPGVLLQSMSGDLGNHGFLEEALALTRPAYDAAVHGLAVGTNLIKASLDTGRLEQARALVEELQRQARPDWVGPLHFWETEVRRAVLAGQAPLPQTPEAPPEVTALAIDGPVWLPDDAPSRTLFATAAPRRAKVLFLAASVTYAEQPAALQGMLPDAPGRLSRALPLFLAESAFLHLGLETTAVIPWVKGHGFAVMGAEWTDADAVEYARSAGAAAAVILHVQQTGDTSEARLRAVRTDAALPGTGGQGSPEPAASVTVPVDWADTGAAALGLWARLANSLLQLAGDAQEHIDAIRYTIPTGPALGNYLLRLEQLLAVRCSGTDTAEGGFLSGEREIVRGQLDLALSLPGSLPLRLILHETLLRLRTLRPEIPAEFRGPVELLMQRYPLADPQANAILEQQLGKIYAVREFSSAAAGS